MAEASGSCLQRGQDDLVHLTQGFEFLGFHIRRYPNGKLLIKPSPKAVKRVKRRLADEMRALRGSNASAVLTRLTPIVRGWTAYYRSVVSARVFNGLDHYLWKLVYKWASWTHANKPKAWIRLSWHTNRG